MCDFTKTVRVGQTADYGNLFCKITCKDGRLSITGVEGPKRNGDCRGSCGQIAMSEWDIAEYAPGWNPHIAADFRRLWGEWHLNDLRAGNSQQMAYIRRPDIEARDWRKEGAKSHHEWAAEVLDAAGLNPQGDRYGHKWHKEEVPQAVLDFFKSLPDTDIQPAWV